jgi:protein ImuB
VPAMSVVPDGPPTWFRWDGVEQVIVDAAGPERIETGWWRNDDIQRDYYRVTTEAGQQFWLFRDRSDGRWYVQGSYE